MTQATTSDGFHVLQDVVYPSVQAVPEYLSKTQYRTPEDPDDCPFQLAHKTGLHYFQWMAEHPRLHTMFNNYMTGSRERTPSWTDKKLYPLEDRLVKGAMEEEGAVFFVDIGGGNGHDIKELCRQYPQVKNQMVLQDQESVIAKLEIAEIDPRVQPMAHNFFEEQPIKGEHVPMHMERLHNMVTMTLGKKEHEPTTCTAFSMIGLILRLIRFFPIFALQ